MGKGCYEAGKAQGVSQLCIEGNKGWHDKKEKREQLLEQLGEERPLRDAGFYNSVALGHAGCKLQGGARKSPSNIFLVSQEEENQHATCRGLEKAAKKKSRCWQALARVLQDKLLLLAGERTENKEQKSIRRDPTLY